MSLFDYPENESATTNRQELDHSTFIFLKDLSDTDWKQILPMVETIHFRQNEILISRGENDDSFYILTKGSVAVLQSDKGSENVLTSIPEGSVFGEMAFFDGQPRSATIRAESIGTVLRFSRRNFESLAAWKPRIARQILFDLGSILAMRLRWTTQKA